MYSARAVAADGQVDPGTRTCNEKGGAAAAAAKGSGADEF